jgi:hypothetical protein
MCTLLICVTTNLPRKKKDSNKNGSDSELEIVDLDEKPGNNENDNYV